MPALASLAFAVGVTLLVWIVVGTALLGIGDLVSRAWRRREDSTDHALNAPRFWLGYAGVVALLQTWNLFARIDAVPLILVLAIGLPFGIRMLLRREGRPTLTRGAAIILALLALWLADRALAAANASDSGLYHLPEIRLANDYAIIPGIGNLMPAFAVGSGNFLFNAMLNVGPLYGRGWHFANSLLLLAFLFRLAPPVTRVLRGEGRLADGFDVALMPLCLFLLMGKDISSPKTDLPAGLLILVMASQLARILCDRSLVHGLRGHVIAAAILGGAAVCVKISTAPMAGLLWLGFAIVWFKRQREDLTGVAVLAIPLLLVAALLPGVFIARNVITSGYPLFPATALPGNVEWRLEPAAVANYHRGFAEFTRFDLALGLAKKVEATPLRFYGRLMNPGFSRLEDATATNWIRGWFFTMLVAWPIEVALPIVLAAVLWWFGRRGDPASRAARRAIALAAVLTLILWFLTVPDGRYIWFATWALAGAAAIPILGERASARGSSSSEHDGAVENSTRVLKHARQNRPLLICLALACVAVVVFRIGLQLIYRDGPILDVFVVRPGPDRGFHPPLAKPQEMATFTSRFGMKIDYPVNGSGTVWFVPQPATPKRYLDPDLRFRGGDLQSGVIIDRKTP